MNRSREFVGSRPNLLFFKHILRKVFLEDWVLKLTALLITFALWYGVSVSSKKGTATMVAQLGFRVSDEAVLMNAGVQEVTIRVAGNDQTIDQLFGNEIRITADLTQVQPGDRILQLTPQSVSTNLPAGIKLEDVQPSRIAVKLEAVEQTDLPVQAATTGEPAVGYEVYSTNVNPARVRVSGPQSFVNTLDSVPTGAVDISGAKSDVVARQVPIAVSNPKVTVFNTIADVSVQIGEKRIERTFVIGVGGKKVTAVLFGPRSLITKAKASDLKADILKAENGDSAQITLPEPLRSAAEIRKVRVD